MSAKPEIVLTITVSPDEFRQYLSMLSELTRKRGEIGTSARRLYELFVSEVLPK